MHLNGTLIRTLREEQQLSPAHAAAIAGISRIVLRRIEDNDPRGAAMLTVQGLSALAETLGTPAGDLIRSSRATPTTGSDQPTDASKDARVLSGLLLSLKTQTSRSDISSALGWNHERIRAAIAALNEQLSGTGLVLHQPHDRLQLVPEQRATIDDALTRITTTKHVKRGMDITTAKTLRRVYDGHHDAGGRKAMNTRAALHTLVSTGALTKTTSGGYTVSDAVRYALDDT